MATTSEILSAALLLSSEQRAEVAHKLLLSLESDESESDIDQVWADEIRQRLRLIREGQGVTRDWSVALKEIRQSLASKGGA